MSKEDKGGKHQPGRPGGERRPGKRPQPIRVGETVPQPKELLAIIQTDPQARTIREASAAMFRPLSELILIPEQGRGEVSTFEASVAEDREGPKRKAKWENVLKAKERLKAVGITPGMHMEKLPVDPNLHTDPDAVWKTFRRANGTIDIKALMEFVAGQLLLVPDDIAALPDARTTLTLINTLGGNRPKPGEALDDHAAAFVKPNEIPPNIDNAFEWQLKLQLYGSLLAMAMPADGLGMTPAVVAIVKQHESARQSTAKEAEQREPDIHPLMHMVNEITGNDPKDNNAFEPNDPRLASYERQHARWKADLHPVTQALVSLAHSRLDEAGVTVAKRKQADEETRQGQRLLDTMIIAADNDLPVSEKIAHMIMILGNSKATDSSILVSPARDNVHALSLATALDGIDQICKSLDQAPASMQGIHSLFFSSANGPEQEDAALNIQIRSGIFQTLQYAIIAGAAAIEIVNGQLDPREFNLKLANLRWQHKVLQAGVAGAMKDLLAIMEAANASGTTRYLLGVDSEENNQVEPPTVTQRLFALRRDTSTLN